MGYIYDNIGKNEEITNYVNFHWIVWISPIFWLILSISAPFIYGRFLLLPAMIPILMVLIRILSIICIEQAITTRRCMQKTGIISINTEEMLLSKVETVEIRISMIGRILGYGGIKITGTGNSYLVFNNITNPRLIKTNIEDLIDKK